MPKLRGVTQEVVRSIALALPGVSEGAHHGHADFRVDGAFFLGFNRDGRWVNLRAAAANIDAMIRADPLTYRRCVEGSMCWCRCHARESEGDAHTGRRCPRLCRELGDAREAPMIGRRLASSAAWLARS